MPCFRPLLGWRARESSSPGRRPIVFNPQDGFVDLPVKVPCGQCTGCRIDRSKAWAARCYHEASEHDENCFITLTYATEKLPSRSSLDITHFQKFMKRVRKRYGSGIKVFYCGEYGPVNWRPHFHALLFGLDFKDKKQWKKNANGNIVYTSEDLEQLWSYGFCTLGAVTFQSAAYVARYIMKKVTGEIAEQHYQRVCPETGEIYQLTPEFCHMSRGGRNGKGIGHGWIEKFNTDAYSQDFIVIDNKKVRVPRFYDEYLNIIDPKKKARITGKRKLKAKSHAWNNTPERLRVRENVLNAKLQLLSRKVE